MTEARFHSMPDGRKIAFRHAPGTGPAIVFLPGYCSDMTGSKATAVLGWAETSGRECLLFDYSGCGESSGEFADGTLGLWLEEATALVAGHLEGRIVLVGSSMGGWLMLLLARALSQRLAGLVGIAAAPDFTDWGFSEAQKEQLGRGRAIDLDNPYGPEPTPVHAAFWSDAQDRRLLGHEIPIDCPVRLLHGQDDADVPPEISLRLARAVRSQDVQVTLVKGGDHRLSREGDIALLLRTVAALA